MSKIIFVDRDGVINEFPGLGFYVTRWEDFRFLPGALEAIALLTRAGYATLVLSNQGCVAKGLLSESALQEMTGRMLRLVEAEGGRIDGVYYCRHETSDNCECKKPNTGLFKQAAEDRPIDFGSAFFIGDTAEDVEAGKRIGCKTILVLSGKTHGTGEAARFTVKPDAIKKDLLEAAQWVIKNAS